MPCPYFREQFTEGLRWAVSEPEVCQILDASVTTPAAD
jgi:hypothetical protein